MDKPTFESLLLLLETHGGFVDSKYVSAGEKLLASILVLTGNSNREINERWQHSGSTISLLVHEVADTFKRCQQHAKTMRILHLPDNTFRGSEEDLLILRHSILGYRAPSLPNQ